MLKEYGKIETHFNLCLINDSINPETLEKDHLKQLKTAFYYGFGLSIENFNNLLCSTEDISESFKANVNIKKVEDLKILDFSKMDADREQQIRKIFDTGVMYSISVISYFSERLREPIVERVFESLVLDFRNFGINTL